jgi:uncharacterized membrane protein
MILNKLFPIKLISILTSLLFFSCHHNSDIPAIPVVTFSGDVQAILVGNCTQGGCHGAGNDHRRFSLVTYEDVMNSGTVIAGDARNSNLYKAITGRNNIMPKAPQAPLTDDQIRFIFIWIAQGAKK